MEIFLNVENPSRVFCRAIYAMAKEAGYTDLPRQLLYGREIGQLIITESGKIMLYEHVLYPAEEESTIYDFMDFFFGKENI